MNSDMTARQAKAKIKSDGIGRLRLCADRSVTRFVDIIRRLTLYSKLARPEHWVKNVFMLVGTAAGFAIHSKSVVWPIVDSLMLAVISTCLISSSNYVLNEILDASYDRHHPEKRFRPLALGLLSPGVAYLEWVLLGSLALVIAIRVNLQFFFAALSLFIMAVFYNTPPIRLKELPVVDVLSEAINNPIRFLLGWFALGLTSVPPSSLLVGCWTFGAFVLAGKRFAEYNEFKDALSAAQYRRSFHWYTGDSLMISMLVYASMTILSCIVGAAQYRPELLLSIPFLALLMAYIAKLAVEPDSILRFPERLFVHPTFIFYSAVYVVMTLVLAFVTIPWVRALFGVIGPTR
jgi:decaprenyl-phosphate phosphoribosyltransferase